MTVELSKVNRLPGASEDGEGLVFNSHDTDILTPSQHTSDWPVANQQQIIRFPLQFHTRIIVDAEDVPDRLRGMAKLAHHRYMPDRWAVSSDGDTPLSKINRRPMPGGTFQLRS